MLVLRHEKSSAETSFQENFYIRALNKFMLALSLQKIHGHNCGEAVLPACCPPTDGFMAQVANALHSTAKARRDCQCQQHLSESWKQLASNATGDVPFYCELCSFCCFCGGIHSYFCTIHTIFFSLFLCLPLVMEPMSTGVGGDAFCIHWNEATKVNRLLTSLAGFVKLYLWNTTTSVAWVWTQTGAAVR